MLTPENRKKAADFVQSDDAYASSLFVLMADAFGDESMTEWDEETIRLECLDTFGAEPSQENMDRLLGLFTALTTDMFYTDPMTFIHVCNALSGEGADFRTFDPATVDEMLWAVTEVLLHENPEQDVNKLFGPAVLGYVRTQMESEGMTELPPPLAFIDSSEKAKKNFEEAASMDSEIYAAVSSRNIEAYEEAAFGVRFNLDRMLKQIEGLPLSKFDPRVWRQYTEQLIGEPQKTE